MTKTVVDLQVALEFAEKKHGDQKYGDNPYMYHVYNVANLCLKFGHSMEHHIVAVLHDTIEDTDTTFYEIEELFGTEIAECVVALTRCNDESYNEYLDRVMVNKMAKEVKVCDLITNLDHSVNDGDFNRIFKYKKALDRLWKEGVEDE